VLSETLNVLSDLAAHGPTAAEIERAKARLRWQMLELYDLPTELSAFVGQGVLSGLEPSPEARVLSLMDVGVERVRAAAQRIFRAQQSSLVVIGKLDRRAQAKLRAAQNRLGA